MRQRLFIYNSRVSKKVHRIQHNSPCSNTHLTHMHTKHKRNAALLSPPLPLLWWCLWHLSPLSTTFVLIGHSCIKLFYLQWICGGHEPLHFQRPWDSSAIAKLKFSSWNNRWRCSVVIIWMICNVLSMHWNIHTCIKMEYMWGFRYQIWWSCASSTHGW